MWRVRCDSLITRSCGSITSSGGNLKAFERFSMSMSMMSVAASERPVLGNDPTGDRMTPPQATDVSRIEIRLFRDTRSVLEYLSQADILVSNYHGMVCVLVEIFHGTYNFPITDVLRTTYKGTSGHQITRISCVGNELCTYGHTYQFFSCIQQS